MSQETILDFLKANPSKWLRSEDICKGIGVAQCSAQFCLKKLRAYKQVSFYITKNPNNQGGRKLFYYKHKR
jgi:hypothetical protein